MKNKTPLLVAAAVVVLTILFVFLLKPKAGLPTNQIQPQPVKETEKPTWKSYTFEKIGLTFSAPSDMTVDSEQSDESIFTFTVQRGAYPDQDYYQLYASLQITENPENDVESVKGDLVDGSKNTTIGGFKAVQGQYKGERNRFVTFIFTDRGILTSATSQPTPENEKITDSILKTFTFEKLAEKPTPKVDTVKSVQESLSKKYNKPAGEVNITVNKEVNGFASGSVLFGQGGVGEGGMWLAVLTDNKWEVVWDGNGSVDCSKMRGQYKFPDSILKPNFCD